MENNNDNTVPKRHCVLFSYYDEEDEYDDFDEVDDGFWTEEDGSLQKRSVRRKRSKISNKTMEDTLGSSSNTLCCPCCKSSEETPYVRGKCKRDCENNETGSTVNTTRTIQEDLPSLNGGCDGNGSVIVVNTGKNFLEYLVE